MAGEKEGSLADEEGDSGGGEKVCCSAEMRAWAAERAWGVGSESISVREEDVSFFCFDWRFLGGRTWEGFVVGWDGHCCFFGLFDYSSNRCEFFWGYRCVVLNKLVGLLRMVVVDDGKAEEFRDSYLSLFEICSQKKSAQHQAEMDNFSKK